MAALTVTSNELVRLTANLSWRYACRIQLFRLFFDFRVGFVFSSIQVGLQLDNFQTENHIKKLPRYINRECAFGLFDRGTAALGFRHAFFAVHRA